MALIKNYLKTGPAKEVWPVVLLWCAILALQGCVTPVQSNETTIQVTVGKAISAYEKGDYAEAVKHYRQLIEILPKDSELWFRLGNAYARQGNSMMAIEAYSEALVRDPQDSRAWHNRGMVQLEMAAANYAEAIATLKAGDPMVAVANKASEEILLLLNRINRQSQSSSAEVPAVQGQPGSNPTGQGGGVEVIVLNKPETLVFFEETDLTSSYSDQDKNGSHQLADGRLTLAGNTWRKLLVDYEVTPDTLLSFEVRILKEGEIHAIGLDEDNKFDNQVRLYQLAGSQVWRPSSEGDDGDGAWQSYRYANQGEWQRVVIPVGQQRTGRFKYLVIANDDDSNQGAVSEYRNVGLSEGRTIGTDL